MRPLEDVDEGDAEKRSENASEPFPLLAAAEGFKRVWDEDEREGEGLGRRVVAWAEGGGRTAKGEGARDELALVEGCI